MKKITTLSLALGVSITAIASPVAHAAIGNPVSGDDKVGASSVHLQTDVGMCSGALISPEWIASAAHCFKVPGDTSGTIHDKGTIGFGSGEGNSSSLSFDNTGTFSEVHLQKGGEDIALVKIDPAKDGNYNPSSLSPISIKKDWASFPGENGTLYGWGGITEDVIDTLNSVSGVFRQSSKINDIDPLTEVLGMDALDKNHDIRPGDSGGMVEIDGELIGILSQTSERYVPSTGERVGDTAWVVPIARYAQWVEETTGIDMSGADKDASPIEDDDKPDEVTDAPDEPNDVIDTPDEPTNVPDTSIPLAPVKDRDKNEDIKTHEPQPVLTPQPSNKASLDSDAFYPEYSTPKSKVIASTNNTQAYVAPQQNFEKESVHGAKVNTGGKVEQEGLFKKVFSIFI